MSIFTFHEGVSLSVEAYRAHLQGSAAQYDFIYFFSHLELFHSG